jgi:predicted CXXCH cytochrome family protein
MAIPMNMRLMVLLITGVFLLVGLIFPGAVITGDWHYGGKLACSDCHTVHDSGGNIPLRYDGVAAPAPSMLRAATPMALCVYCHDGSRGDAPDVIAPVTYVPDPAGGFFANTGGTGSFKAHDLAMQPAVTAPGGTATFSLTCISCHDPHGNANYRNLRVDPTGTGGAPAVTVVAKQKVTANGSNPSAVYIPSNVTYKSGMSQWCGSCHTNFLGKSMDKEGVGSPWLRHPSDVTISTAKNVDKARWSGTITNRVPVQSPNDDTIPSADDQVFCLSCHKAHGSGNPFALIYSDGSTLSSTCQQCHSQGVSGSGAGIATVSSARTMRRR